MSMPVPMPRWVREAQVDAIGCVVGLTGLVMHDGDWQAKEEKVTPGAVMPPPSQWATVAKPRALSLEWEVSEFRKQVDLEIQAVFRYSTEGAAFSSCPRIDGHAGICSRVPVDSWSFISFRDILYLI